MILNLLNSAVGQQSVTMTQHLAVVRGWWEGLTQTGEASTEAVSAKLLDLGVIHNGAEGLKLLGRSDEVTFRQFQQVFTRSVLKGALLSLAQRLSSKAFAMPFLSHSMKLSAYKRRLLISRFEPSVISKAEGETALQAIEKYKRIVMALADAH